MTIAISPDDQYVAAGFSTGEIRVWRMSDFQQIYLWREHLNWVRSIAFSPDGQILASGSEDQTIRLWDVHSGSCLRKLNVNSHVRSVAFSCNGHLIASANEDKKVRVWDKELEHCLSIFKEHTGKVYTVYPFRMGRLNAVGVAKRALFRHTMTL